MVNGIPAQSHCVSEKVWTLRHALNEAQLRDLPVGAFTAVMQLSLLCPMIPWLYFDLGTPLQCLRSWGNVVLRTV